MSKQELRESIIHQLKVNPRLVERAIVVLYQRQTLDEQSSGMTVHSNGMGFSAWAAKYGTYYGKYVLSGRRLTGIHLDRARSIAIKHIRQLVELALVKQRGL
jgi:hypothetical protein